MPPSPRLELDRETFLARYWQREPLHMPAAVAGFETPLDPDEIAGLAMEETLESRLIECDGDGWRVHHGPFVAADFRRALPFSLLVQAVDHVVPAVAQLRRLADFLPGWRIDDIMVSYGDDGASVGPHYDNYDVFLLQGAGDKLWRIGQRCDTDTRLLPHPELRILADFECTAEYVLGPGDVLYVPPGVAHWGIARGESTTFSIGFRAPRLNDMLSRRADAVLERIDTESFFTDPGRPPAQRAGEITAGDRRAAADAVQRTLSAHAADCWFGELVTEPRADLRPDGAALRALRERWAAGGATLSLDPAARVAWQEDEAGVTVFANGDSLQLPRAAQPVIETLCATWRLEPGDWAGMPPGADGSTLVQFLLESGCLDVG